MGFYTEMLASPPLGFPPILWPKSLSSFIPWPEISKFSVKALAACATCHCASGVSPWCKTMKEETKIKPGQSPATGLLLHVLAHFHHLSALVYLPGSSSSVCLFVFFCNVSKFTVVINERDRC